MADTEDLLRRIATLEHQLQTLMEQKSDTELDRRIGILEDIEAIKRLQRSYGYYLDALQYDAIADLFADKGATMEVGQRGRYEGKETIRKFLYDVLGTGHTGLAKDQIINHTQHQAIVDVDPDRTHAKARWRAFVQANIPAPREGEAIAAQDEPAMMWAEGVYENSYVKEGETWKIQVMWWSPTFYVLHPAQRLWFDSTPASETFPPAAPSHTPNPALGRVFVPYHYSHPITGETYTDITAKD